MSRYQVLTLVLSLMMVVLSGTVFFKLVEGWTWLDAYFFTVVTLSTVGYGSLVPATPLGKIGTTVFIFVGLGVFAFAVHQFGTFTMRKREEHTEWLFGRLGRKDAEPEPANEDRDPQKEEA
ncbi:potassium channel family protein [Thalassococcus sp. S3]|uniref:potassium channel family protein n=1 Tax=Thalassococcus sp. S3 TaxID=2017482 RepID=UPI0010241472|nr:potassium channel family protein [Thalassococcus sp. S3]QBF31754.1 potassium channel protein [Thalassococcus sp. S3]